MIIDKTKECTKNWPNKRRHRRRKLDNVSMLVIHRSHLEHDAVSTSKRFDDHALGTGGKMPYHFFIDDNGNVTQCLPIDRLGPGAMGVNSVAIHIAIHGDLRRVAIKPGQARALGNLVRDLCSWMGHATVWGHTELANASSDPLKECPGRRMSMEGLREIARGGMERWDRADATGKLRQRGYVV
jgi:N-acetyl-anhydromuramyl-L-alanine amidase AmpD